MAAVLCAVPLAATGLSAGFTYEQSLYVRAELPAAIGGTLYVEVNLGPDADEAEDTFISVRQHRQERWSVSGDFAQALQQMARHFLAQ